MTYVYFGHNYNIEQRDYSCNQALESNRGIKVKNIVYIQHSLHL